MISTAKRTRRVNSRMSLRTHGRRRHVLRRTRREHRSAVAVNGCALLLGTLVACRLSFPPVLPSEP